MKKMIISFSLILFSISAFILFGSLDKNAELSNQKEYARHPPIPKGFWIQKDKKAEDKTILMVKFESDYKLPYLIRLNFLGKKISLQDAGKHPDLKTKDGIYSTLIDIKPNHLARDIAFKYKKIAKKGYYVTYKGHTAKTVTVNKKFAFDMDQFNKYIPVPLIPEITNTECNANIKKQQSLFITDLKVVEDLNRTYKLITYDNNGGPTFTTAGTPLGEWTFGNLMQNMAGGPFDATDPNDSPDRIRDFLKEWVIALYRDYQYNGEHSLNNTTAQSNTPMRLWRERGVFYHLIEPWLLRTYGKTLVDEAFVNFDNWEGVWDAVHTPNKPTLEDLLKHAPFKLTAIVNRVDLRENMLYTNSIHSGEVRFIFTLIETVQGGDKGEISATHLINDQRHPTVMLGKPPHHINQANVNTVNDVRMDWQGMNVILEYGIPYTDFCDLKAYMKKWYRLSELNLDNTSELSTYLNELGQLTHEIIKANAMPGQKNGSAISQVRTNDRLFHLTANGASNGWSPLKWELRQFELQGTIASSMLTNAPVTNTPLASTNFAPNTLLFINPTDDTSVIDWVFGTNQNNSHINIVESGNYNLPDYVLSPTAIVKENLVHHYGFDWNDVTYRVDSPTDKELQRQISLNSCQGCHNNETKTLFTMVRPLGYGEEANYWDTTSPSTTTGKMDTRFYEKNAFVTANTGKTYDNYLQTTVDNFKPVSELAGTMTIPNVSPFITGRNFINGSFADDEDGSIDYDANDSDFNDEGLEGLFYVNNPNNQSDVNANSGPYPNNHNDRNGFNELERRQTHLCNLVDGYSCQSAPFEPAFDNNNIYSFYGLIKEISFVPFPEQSH